MKKVLSLALVLCLGLCGVCTLSASAKGGRHGGTHHVSGHSRTISTVKNGCVHTRTIHVNGYRSH